MADKTFDVIVQFTDIPGFTAKKMTHVYCSNFSSTKVSIAEFIVAPHFDFDKVFALANDTQLITFNTNKTVSIYFYES